MTSVESAVFLRAVGHHLRTPLTGIKASVSSLRQTDVDWSENERREFLEYIEESADRLDRMVANLLDASRLQAGSLKVTVEPVALDEAISAALVALPGAVPTVKVELPDDLPPVQADRALLARALANVIDNACKAGSSSDEPVEVTAFARDQSVEIAIVDHGPGVPGADRERIFEPFHGLDDRRSKGIGLGLAVARGFVEAMDGSLVARATYGVGLTMRLRLPAARE